MGRNVSEILCEIEARSLEGTTRALALLPVKNGAFECLAYVGRLQYPLAGSSICRTLLEAASSAFSKCKVERSLAYDPFDLFWDNPDEPRHSRLLAYFVNPRSEHTQGLYLLRLFVKALDILDPGFPVDEECNVSCEKGHIDLLICRDREDGKYALIIENKVNGAKDQESQLQRYFDQLRVRGFEEHQIYVCYLPLRPGSPSADSIGTIPKERLWLRSFNNHIIPWLQCVLVDQVNRPVGMAEDMRDNLKHYLDLLMWRLNTEKIIEMKETIFKMLSVADNEKRLPSIEEITSIRQSAQALEECYLRLMRVKTFAAVRRLLEEREHFGSCSDWRDGSSDLLSTDYVYWYPVNELVVLGFGEDKGGVYLAYGPPKVKGKVEMGFEAFVRKEDPSLFVGKSNEHWYAWDYPGIDATRPEDTVRLADLVISMRQKMESLVRHFKAASRTTILKTTPS